VLTCRFNNAVTLHCPRHGGNIAAIKRINKFGNSARLMLRYAIPTGRPAIATTSTGHSLYAGGALFDAKAMEELGYVPRRVIARLTPYEFAFLPDPRSTHRDNRDPLDP